MATSPMGDCHPHLSPLSIADDRPALPRTKPTGATTPLGFHATSRNPEAGPLKARLRPSRPPSIESTIQLSARIQAAGGSSHHRQQHPLLPLPRPTPPYANERTYVRKKVNARPPRASRRLWRRLPASNGTHPQPPDLASPRGNPPARRDNRVFASGRRVHRGRLGRIRPRVSMVALVCPRRLPVVPHPPFSSLRGGGKPMSQVDTSQSPDSQTTDILRDQEVRRAERESPFRGAAPRPHLRYPVPCNPSPTSYPNRSFPLPQGPNR